MLLVGDFQTIKSAYENLSIKNSNIHIINLSSANASLKPSSLFYVPTIDLESNTYDINYANYIFQNTPQRIELLFMIYHLHIGEHVLITIGRFPGMYEMAESLLKLIQSRYGYNGYMITENDVDDLDLFESRFTTEGLMLFDQEKRELDEIFLQQERGY